ncbi:MAG: rod shape-determining protein MreC [Pseudomonadota bacterium]
MTPGKSADNYGSRVVRRIGVLFTLLICVMLTLLWRFDNTRAERIRLAVFDQVMPVAELVHAPISRATDLVANLQSYERLLTQNAELRRELQQMKAWREAAIQLEQENAKLLDLNKVKLKPSLSFISGEVLIEAASPFRQSALINLGSDDRIRDGWAAMDGLGLVGRIAGVGTSTARVLLITDTESRIPVLIKPSDERALIVGDNSQLPLVAFLEREDFVRPGDRVFTSGDGGVFPSDLLVGTVVRATDGRLRLRPSADLLRLEFVRVIRHSPSAPITVPERLIGPTFPLSERSVVTEDG